MIVRKKYKEFYMKEKFKTMLRWFGWFAVCFLIIYLMVFVGGWKLFESGDPILVEVGAAVILSIFVFAGNEAATELNKKVKALEERIEALEKNK